MPRHNFLFISGLTLAVIGLSAPASASPPGYVLDQGSWESGYAQQFVEPGTVKHHRLSRGEAIAIAKQRARGKVLSADLIERGSKAFYKVKILTPKGHVRTLRIDANR